MWVQTWHPGHPLYQALGRHDYRGSSPPASCASARAPGCRRTRTSPCCAPKRRLSTPRAPSSRPPRRRRRRCAESADVMVYAPVPLDVARVADVERMQMLVESASRVALQAMLHAWLPQLDALHVDARRREDARPALGHRCRSADDLTGKWAPAQRWARRPATSASSSVARTSCSTASARSAGGASVSISARSASTSSSVSVPTWR